MKKYEDIDFCLLIPCYNNFHGLISSLYSVVYPASRFLVLVIDDGSTEQVTQEKVHRLIQEDYQVVVLHNEKNIGITAALNKGLAWIEENTNARYIARLDCGDTCDARRFSIQVKFLDSHSTIGLLGSWCRFEDKETKISYTYKTPARHKEILKAMYFRNLFIHPAVMFRTCLLKEAGYYPYDYEYAEDYAFFWKLIKARQSAILTEILVTCELNKGGISYKNKRNQLLARARVVRTFGSNLVFRIIAYCKLLILFLVPRRMTLQIKKWMK